MKRRWLVLGLLISLLGASLPPASLARVAEAGLSPVSAAPRLLGDGICPRIQWVGEDRETGAARSLGAAKTSPRSDIYSCYEVYNRLDPAFRGAWDELDGICRPFYDGTADAPADHSLGRVTIYGRSRSEVQDFYWMYRFLHPQYFFLDNTIRIGGGEGFFSVYPVCYAAFADGGARGRARQAFEEALDDWAAPVASEPTDAKKVQKIHDLICSRVSYDASITQREQSTYSQSAYSALVLGTSVCAGYSLAFEALCNRFGIPAISLTGEAHGWNQVCIDGFWYGVDCTWDDRDTGRIYTYFLRSDAKLKALDRCGFHTPDSGWEAYRPLCTADSGSGVTAPGSCAVPRSAACRVRITAERAGSGYTVRMAAPEAGRIFYTTDGTTPSASGTKSFLYTRPITEVASGVTLRALWTQNGYVGGKVVSLSTGDPASGESVPADAAGISIDKTSTAVASGSIVTLRVKVTPADYSGAIRWWAKGPTEGVYGIYSRDRRTCRVKCKKPGRLVVTVTAGKRKAVSIITVKRCKKD